jgi:hypothetical protein
MEMELSLTGLPLLSESTTVTPTSLPLNADGRVGGDGDGDGGLDGLGADPAADKGEVGTSAAAASDNGSGASSERRVLHSAATSPRRRSTLGT